jgi:preprotein translocase subunit SecA
MEASILSKQIENAQKKVEEQNFVSRKNVLKYDDVMNVQRMTIYEQRRAVLEGEDLSEDILGWSDEFVANLVHQHTQSEYQEEWDLAGLLQDMNSLYPSQVELEELTASSMTREELIEEFQDDARDAYAAKEEELSSDVMREIERYLVLQVVDARWREHLDAMEYLREGIHLRAMAQKDPLSEYRAEGHTLFQELTATIREEVLRYLFHIEIEREEAERLTPAAANGGRDGNLTYEHESLAGADAIAAAGAGAAAAGGATAVLNPPSQPATQQQRIASEEEKIGRNDPCWCGSGKKYKKCHGA